MHRLYDPVTKLMRDVADEIIMPRFQMLAADEIKEKTPGDLVTIADQESETRLGEALLALLPGSTVIGEEAVAANAGLLGGIGKGLVWIIDPLDGTLNFAEGKSPFAVMIGLLADGEAQAGWILDAVTGRICHGGARSRRLCRWRASPYPSDRRTTPDRCHRSLFPSTRTQGRA